MKVKLPLEKNNLIILLIIIVAGMLVLQSMQINTISNMIEQKLENSEANLIGTAPVGVTGESLPLLLGECNLG